MQCWVGTCIREWWPMVPTQKNCTWGHQSRAPKSSFCCQPSAGRLRAHFDENLFCRTTTQSEDRTQECSRATHRTTWGSGGGEKKVVGGCGGFGGCQGPAGASVVKIKKEKKARDLPHFSATSVGGRTQSTAKEKGKDAKRGQPQTQVVLRLGRCDGGTRNLKMKGSGDSLKDGNNVRATTTKQGTRRERDATTDLFGGPIGRREWIRGHFAVSVLSVKESLS